MKHYALLIREAEGDDWKLYGMAEAVNIELAIAIMVTEESLKNPDTTDHQEFGYLYACDALKVARVATDDDENPDVQHWGDGKKELLSSSMEKL